MEPQTILQIVSGFKPSADGMGDFSRLLGAALLKNSSIRSHFLIYHPRNDRQSAAAIAQEIHPNTISFLDQATPEAFLQEVASLRQTHSFACALLHYGPYGYSRDGKPLPFARAIEELGRTMRLFVFFHEAYARGWPWKRAFWTRPDQVQSIRLLLTAASVSYTSNVQYALWLQPLNRTGREIQQIPIFSNVGEPENPRPLAQRESQLIVFGQLVTRVRIYKDRRPILEDLCRRLKIEKVVDVGSGKSPHIPTSLAGAPVRSSGFMDELQLSELMSDSIAGVVGYWPDVWEKSGVVAAYCAHALVPIFEPFEKRKLPAPRFVPYVLAQQIVVLSGKDGTVPLDKLQSIADAAFDNYHRTQSIDRCAEKITRSMLQQSPLN